jgi:hypothetical protein
MSQPAVKIKYPEMETFWDRALASEKGIAITLETPQKATRRSLELNAFRASVRKGNALIYPLGDPMHDATPWDRLVVQKDRDNPCRILIKEREVETVSVEEL